MAALHLDNLLFLLFVALAIFFQILTRAATKSRNRPGDPTRRSTSPSQMSRPLSREPDETDEQRIRKFLEALGQPTTSKPPPPVAVLMWSAARALPGIYGSVVHRFRPARAKADETFAMEMSIFALDRLGGCGFWSRPWSGFEKKSPVRRTT